ncbi:hypothetical protein D3C87_1932900 [compost metagenome]
MLVEFLVGTGGTEGRHADEGTVAADEMIPTLADAGFDGDLDRRVADDRLLVVFALFGKELEAGNRDDAGRDALGGQCLASLDGDFDFRAGGEDRHLGVA